VKRKLENIAPEDCAIAADAFEALRAVLARNPAVLMIVYETSDAAGYAPVPAADAVARGLYIQVGNALFPDAAE